MPEEAIWEMAWRRAFGVAMLQTLVPVLACYLGMLVLFYRRREWSVAVLCTFCLLPPALPFGILVAAAFGWLRAGRWGLRAFMTLWTFLIVLVIADLAAVLVLREMDSESLRRLFGLGR